MKPTSTAAFINSELINKRMSQGDFVEEEQKEFKLDGGEG